MPDRDELPLCTGALLRRTMRRVSQCYDDALRPLDLKLTQYSVLVNLAEHPGSTITDLAGLLEMDRTTLTRNLGPLQRRGLVAVRPGASPRQRAVALTEDGKSLVRRAIPIWLQAEKQIRGMLGEPDIDDLQNLLDRLLRLSKGGARKAV